MKTLVVCLDGASFEVLDRFRGKEGFDFLEEMRDEGIEAEFYAPIPQTAASAASIASGMNPGKTGVYRFDAGKSRIAKAKDIDTKRIWHRLDENNVDHAMLHIPLTYPPEDSGEVFASGKLTPSADSDYVRPEEVKERFEFPYDGDLEERIEARFQNLEETLSDGIPDLIFLWIDETDNVQHFHWNEEEKVEKAFRLCIQRIQEIQESHEFDNIVLISDHGFDEVAPRNFHVNSWLREQGYLETEGGSTSTSVKTKLYQLGKEHLPPRIKSFLRRRLMQNSPGEEDSEAIALVPGVDFDETRVFYDKGWGVKIIEQNLEQDYEEFRKEVIEKLEQLKDDEGEPVFKEVRQGEKFFHGPHTGEAKDVYLMPTNKYYLTRMLKPDFFDDEEIQHKKDLEGNHNSNPEGIFIAKGRDFGSGKIDRMEVYDLLPTLMHLHGLRVPENVDGEVRRDAFNPGSEASERSVEHYSGKELGIDV